MKKAVLRRLLSRAKRLELDAAALQRRCEKHFEQTKNDWMRVDSLNAYHDVCSVRAGLEEMLEAWKE